MTMPEKTTAKMMQEAMYLAQQHMKESQILEIHGPNSGSFTNIFFQVLESNMKQLNSDVMSAISASVSSFCPSYSKQECVLICMLVEEFLQQFPANDHLFRDMKRQARAIGRLPGTEEKVRADLAKHLSDTEMK